MFKWKQWILYLIVVFISAILIVYRFNHLQAKQLEMDLRLQAETLESNIDKNTTYIENILHYVANAMAINNYSEDPEIILNNLDVTKKDTKLDKILTNVGVEWADKQHAITVSSQIGIHETPIDIAYRDYIPYTVDQPGKLRMGKAALGSTSKLWMLPAGFGVDNSAGQYIGAFVMGIEIAKISKDIDQSLTLKGIKGGIIDTSLQPFLYFSGIKTDLPNTSPIRKLLKQLDFSRNIDFSYLDSSFLRLETNYYVYKLNDQPYVIYFSYDQRLPLAECATVIWENASEFLLIVLCTLIALYFVHKVRVSKPSLSQEYFVFAVVTTSVATGIMLWLLLSFYKYQDDDIKYRYSTEAEKIVESVNEQFSYVENLARFIGEKIASLRQGDATSISTLLSSRGNLTTQKQDLFSWSLFDFIDTEGNVVASSSQGVLVKPRRVANRSYMEDARRRPWKLHLSEPAFGITSGEYVIPAGLGITNKQGSDYLGTLSMGFNVNRLVRKLESILASESSNFVLLDKATGSIILQSSGNIHPISKDFFSHRLDYIRASEMDAGMLPDPIAYNGIVYKYFRNMYEYPYILLVGESKHSLERQFKAELLPRFIEFGGMWIFILLLLFFFRMKIVSPLLELSNAAKALSQGEVDVVIPRPRSVETSHLAHSLLHVKRTFQREAKLKQQLQEAKEAADLANAAKSEFLSSTVHELRSPLNAIIGMAEVIKLRAFNNNIEKYAEYAADIEYSGYELLEFVTDLLDMNKAESGHFSLATQEWVDLSNVIHRAIKLNISRAHQANISILTDIGSNIPTIYGDSRRLRQVLVNLISNSIKYSPEDTCITVGLHQQEDSRVTLTVTDQGMGMSPEGITVALQKWGKAHDDTAVNVDSFGLGLPLAKHLIELHGAEFHIHSEPGKGTVVTMVFPLGQMGLPV